MNMRPIQDILSAFNSANLEDRIRYNLDSVVEKEVKAAYNASHLENAARCMDYTSLRLTDTADTIRNFITDLLKKLKKFELPAVAAVCVFPKYAGIAREMLQSSGIRSAVVAGNFPTAQTFTEIKLAECRKAIEAGAEEIDTVLSVGDLLEKNYEAVYEELCAIRETCQGVTLKIILETGELKDIETIFNASLIAAYAGADFIKTSTGKVPVNATPESVYAICEAIRQYHEQTGRRVGLKAAGGISKAQTVIRYMTIVRHVLDESWLTPATFRIGASHLMDDLVKEIKALPKEEQGINSRML